MKGGNPDSPPQEWGGVGGGVDKSTLRTPYPLYGLLLIKWLVSCIMRQPVAELDGKPGDGCSKLQIGFFSALKVCC
jgi:hypothetical protein